MCILLVINAAAFIAVKIRESWDIGQLTNSLVII